MKKLNELRKIRELRTEAFWKSLRVVQSCTKLEQLDTAKNYINQFMKVFTKHRGELYMTDYTVTEQYDILKTALEEQKDKIVN